MRYGDDAEEDLMEGKELDVFEKHQKAIAIKTLKMPNAIANVMGGMTKKEAVNFLKKIGWSDQRIRELGK